jgi:hypothetical protein
MRTFVLVGAFVVVNVIGAVAFFVAAKIAGEPSHLSDFMVAIVGVAAAVGSAFPIFGRAVPWAASRLGLVAESASTFPHAVARK